MADEKDAEKPFDTTQARAIRNEVMKYVWEVIEALQRMEERYKDHVFTNEEDCTECIRGMRAYVQKNLDRLNGAWKELQRW